MSVIKCEVDILCLCDVILKRMVGRDVRAADICSTVSGLRGIDET